MIEIQLPPFDVRVDLAPIMYNKHVIHDDVLTGLVLLPPLKNGPKKDTRGRKCVVNHRKIVPGIKPAAKYQHTLERAGSYPISSRRPTVSDVSLVR